MLDHQPWQAAGLGKEGLFINVQRCSRSCRTNACMPMFRDLPLKSCLGGRVSDLESQRVHLQLPGRARNPRICPWRRAVQGPGSPRRTEKLYRNLAALRRTKNGDLEQYLGPGSLRKTDKLYGELGALRKTENCT